MVSRRYHLISTRGAHVTSLDCFLSFKYNKTVILTSCISLRFPGLTDTEMGSCFSQDSSLFTIFYNRKSHSNTCWKHTSQTKYEGNTCTNLLFNI